MKIGIDATSWGNKRGYGRFTRAFLGALVELDRGNQYTFYLDSEQDLNTIPAHVDIRLVPVSTPASVAASSIGSRSLLDMLRMSQTLSLSTSDVLLFPTVYSYVPVFSRASKILFIHDVIAERYPHLTLPNLKGRIFWQAKVALGRWQADAIVTVSEFSRDCIAEYFNISKDLIYVVHEASDPVFQPLDRAQMPPNLVSLGFPTSGRYITYVGGFGPHKNLAMLVQVFSSLVARDEFSDLHLVMVGEYLREIFHTSFKELNEKIEALNIADRVTFTGFLTDEELTILLNLSTLLVLPSLMEGFGLPALEAAACGCPVIATRESPLPELLGEGGLYIDPNEPEDLEEALVRVLSSGDLRRRMGLAGAAAAGKLTWCESAKQMMAILERVAGA